MYAKELTKRYLQKLGITKVTEDGHIFTGDKELKQIESHVDGYLRIAIYDKELYRILYPITKCRSAGQYTLPVHRVVYAWFNKAVKNELVVDHIDNNKKNNHISNLQVLTPSENIWKDREHNIKELKCKFRPREYYENKLNYYLGLYEEAKVNKQAARVHSLRSYISQYRARLRYWDSHYANRAI